MRGFRQRAVDRSRVSTAPMLQSTPKLAGRKSQRERESARHAISARARVDCAHARRARHQHARHQHAPARGSIAPIARCWAQHRAMRGSGSRRARVDCVRTQRAVQCRGRTRIPALHIHAAIGAHTHSRAAHDSEGGVSAIGTRARTDAGTPGRRRGRRTARACSLLRAPTAQDDYARAQRKATQGTRPGTRSRSAE